MSDLDQMSDDNLEDEISRPAKRPINESNCDKEKNRKKTKQPTVEEINELKETETLFNNNLFRLQIRELLAATNIKIKYKQKLTDWLNDHFQRFLNDLSEHDPVTIYFSSKKKINEKNQSVVKYFKKYCDDNNLSCDQDISIPFSKFSDFKAFGLYKNESLPGPNLSYNLYLTIPRKCFNEKDYLNNRYVIKKFYYLFYIADQLKIRNICSSIKCAYLYENTLLPYLTVVPNHSDKISINIHFVPEQGSFKPHRFLPDVNNIKVPIYEKDVTISSEESIGEMPTAFYNATLGFDTTLAENQSFLEETLNSLTNVQESLKLIIVWLNQRKVNEGLGAFSNDLVVYIIVYLIIKKKINKLMSSYQVFRSFLYFMNTTDLSQTPISLCEKIEEERREQFKKMFDVVVVDRTGYYNVAAFLNIGVYLKMKEECRLAFHSLDQNTLHSFSDLFLVKIPHVLQYDAIIDTKEENDFKSLLNKVEVFEKVKYLGCHKLLLLKILRDYIKKGLNKRVKNIVPVVPAQTVWDYGISYKIKNPRILFGLTLDPDSAFDILEYGPCLNDPQEKEFKKFWGKLSSNRRFRDGSAKIVVFFDTKTIKDKRNIIRVIVDFVMKEKLKLNFKFHYDEFEEVVVNKKIDAWYPIGTNEETSIKIIRSSDELGRKIRALDIQLGITGIGGISDVFCYTNVFPPIPTSYRSGKTITLLNGDNIILKEKKLHAAPKFVEPIDCAIYLEHSSKWPGDLEALQKMKTLFYLQISKMLKEKHDIVSSVKPSHLDVLYDGIVFRYTLYLSKEVALLKRNVKDNGVLAYRETDVSREIEKKFTVMPKIIGGLKGIQSQWPCYGVSTCIAKRWIRSHLIDEYLLPDVVINLLSAHEFIENSQFIIAVSPQAAFLRFLKYLIEVQWDNEPVVLNFNNELTKDEISNINNKFMVNRNNFPPLYILTPYDNSESIFTKKNPTREVLNRLKILAGECLNIIEKMIMEESLFTIKELFVPNKKGFHCIINLKSVINPRRHEKIQVEENDGRVSFKEPSDDNKYLPVVDFDPVQMYLRELRHNYGTFCVFFHDTYGGDFIGMLWNPKEIESKPTNISHILGRKTVDNKLEIDKEEIIRGFELFGTDILKSIDLKT